MNDEPREALRRLEERLSNASEAAERLIAEAARGARANRPPPAGYQAPDAESDAQPRRPSELEVLLAAAGVLRDLVPPEVLARLAAAVRELLLAARALIDFYLERLDRPRASGERVRDIPID
jgi:hypothetical protein